MSQKIKFSKLHGAGNDFIVIDNDSAGLKGDETELFRQLCDRRFGIGADGLMLIDDLRDDQFGLRYYNADGGQSTMCGNGARCAVAFVHRQNLSIKRYKFVISETDYSAEVIDAQTIKIYWDFYPEIQHPEDLQPIVSSNFLEYLMVDSGVPHLILLLDGELEEVDLEHWGPFFRYHPFFAPFGTNVNVLVIQKNGMKIRTYERGVENETLACGTGVLAAAAAADYWKKIRLPVWVDTRGGRMKVGIQPETGFLWLQGPAQHVFSGVFDPEDFG